ncbi:MAG: tetratricopeptide repeat protein [Candidatus Omnitrophica bacterium]|nr:tetratricopeptide repeat protein [Candidatus Omnitrophota bacterium]
MKKPPLDNSGGFLFGIKHPDFFAGLAIASVVLVLTSVSFGHNFLFDEENIIIRNPLIKDLSRIPDIFRHGFFYYEGAEKMAWNQYFRPLTTLSFALDFQLWRGNPLGYNLTNAALHLAVCLLLFGLLRKILSSRPAAFLAALFFSVHPLHTEAVTYIASRGDLWGALGVLLSLFFYRRGVLPAALVFYALAMLAKESTLLIPFYILAFDLAFMKSARGSLVRKMLCFAGVGAGFLIYRKFFSPVPLGPPVFDAGAALLRFLSMGPAILDYFQAILMPESFKFCLTVDFAKSFQDPRVWVTLYVLAVLGAGFLAAFLKRGAAFFGLSFFLVSLSPYLQIVHFYPEWAEHYLYIPSLGLAGLTGLFIQRIFSLRRTALSIVLVVLCLCYGFFLAHRSWERNAWYNDTGKFYERLSRSDSPYAFYGFQNIARLAIEEGRWEDAIVPLKAALAIEPASDATHQNLGVYYLQKNDPEKALEHFRKAYELAYLNNEYINNEYVLSAANALVQLQRYPEAIEFLEKVQKRTPRAYAVYISLIAAYELSGHPEDALRWAETGRSLAEPGSNDDVMLSMAIVRLSYRQGWDARVKKELSHVIERSTPGSWYGSVARLLAGEMSVGEFEGFVRLKYAAFESAARYYVLMAYALNRQTDLLSKFLEQHGRTLEISAGRYALYQKEIERARRVLISEGGHA